MTNLIQWIDKSMRERRVLRCLSRHTLHFSEVCLARGWTVTEPPQPRLSVCGWLAARVCEALWYWVVKEVGQVFSLPNDNESSVASRFKQGSVVFLGSATLRSLPAAQWKKYNTWFLDLA